ncbi:hypothetical protein [Paenibacillus crassostreae]|uniref:Uncharacterized protein n=1 Tax=Paenibacillus crassostreae TaxID=1763538 RepID=A0A162KRM4_9BACL|nr:hypothetical protein [Paenibacillus crassostreae]AOZ91613.1 hypothetical protein LPB68_04870 [Paenibacillus crassostreae]OAB72813.1 hypothetical protein PNBC_15380 [Paenibacillus crassostreae]
MDVKGELHKAVEKNQSVSLRLASGEFITGVAEVSNDPERVKVRASEGPMWVPYVDVEKVSRVIDMFH